MAEIKRNLDYAIAYLQEKAGAIKRPSGKYLLRQEIRLEMKITRRFKKQLAWILEQIKTLRYFEESKGVRTIQKKDIREDADGILRHLPEVQGMADDMGVTINDVYHKGSRDIGSSFPVTGEVSFNLMNDKARDYVQRLKDLHISDYRGSITRETKGRIQKILVDAVEEGTSYGEVATKIRSQADAGVFSRARAELIAVNQVANAYGQGSDDRIREYIRETGSFIQKAWNTVGDDKVTPECNANQAKGWIGIDEDFPSADEHAPRQTNPRCRCATLYRQVDLQGNPI